jgi:hypothetical protein
MFRGMENIIFGPVEAASRELDRRKQNAERLASRAKEVVEALRTAEAAGADELAGEIDSKALRRISHEIADLRAEGDLIESAARVAATKVAEASVALRRAEIAELRRQAEGKRSESATLQTKSEQLLGQLSDIEEVAFTPVALQAQPSIAGWKVSVRAHSGTPFELCSPDELQRDRIMGGYQTTKSRRLFDEAAKLDRQANDLERNLEAEGR